MKTIDWSTSSTEPTLDYVSVQQQQNVSSPVSNATKQIIPVTNTTKVLDIRPTKMIENSNDTIQTTKATSTTITTTTTTTTTSTTTSTTTTAATPKVAIAPSASNGNPFKFTNRTVTSTTKKLQTVSAKNVNLPFKPTTPKTTLAKSTPTKQTPSKTTTTKKLQNPTRKIAALSINSKVANSSIPNSKLIVPYTFKKPMLFIPILAIIVAISGILVAFLLLWRYSKQNKWKRCNSSIEYRTKNYTNKCDDGNDLLLDDSMSITLIENGGGGGDGDGSCDGNGDDNDDNCYDGETKKKQSIKCDKTRAQNTSTKPDKKMNANNNKETLARIVSKSSMKSSKRIDEFSEKRCLTIDEEQFDFSLQADDM